MSIVKKGWCPTLTRPMETGDGLLVRLHIRYGVLTAENARAIAACAVRYGNGHIDLTSRGNLQIRGVSPENYEALYQEVIALGLTELPRPPRAMHPDYLPPLGFLPTRVGMGTMGLWLAFGRLEAPPLTWLADMAEHSGSGIIFLSPWRAVFIPGIAATSAESILLAAKTAGFITEANDSLRAIQTCPGAPACSSARGETRALSMSLAKAFPDLVAQGKTLHVSGCAKGCACSEKTSVVVIANKDSYDMAFDGNAASSPAYNGLSMAAVTEVAGSHL